MHQIETVIDVFQLQLVRNHRVDLDLAVHIPINNLGYIGTPACTAKGSATPASTCHQLERACRNLLPRAGDADAALAQNSDSETALMQDDLPKILGESQMVLSGLTENRAEFAGAMPTSLEKGTADMKALQAPVGGNVQAQGATNRDEKTELNQVPAWRPALRCSLSNVAFLEFPHGSKS